MWVCFAGLERIGCRRCLARRAKESPTTLGNLALEPCLLFAAAATCYRIFSVYKGIVVTLMGSEPRRGLLRRVRAGRLW